MIKVADEYNMSLTFFHGKGKWPTSLAFIYCHLLYKRYSRSLSKILFEPFQVEQLAGEATLLYTGQFYHILQTLLMEDSE